MEERLTSADAAEERLRRWRLAVNALQLEMEACRDTIRAVALGSEGATRDDAIRRLINARAQLLRALTDFVRSVDGLWDASRRVATSFSMEQSGRFAEFRREAAALAERLRRWEDEILRRRSSARRRP